MGPVDIAIAVAVPVLFIAALAIIIYRKVKRKGSPGCDCYDCGKCSNCPGCDKSTEQEKQ